MTCVITVGCDGGSTDQTHNTQPCHYKRTHLFDDMSWSWKWFSRQPMFAAKCLTKCFGGKIPQVSGVQRILPILESPVLLFFKKSINFSCVPFSLLKLQSCFSLGFSFSPFPPPAALTSSSGTTSCLGEIWHINVTWLIDWQVEHYLLPQKPPSVISSSNTSEKPRPAFNLASRPSMNCNHKLQRAY